MCRRRRFADAVWVFPVLMAGLIFLLSISRAHAQVSNDRSGIDAPVQIESVVFGFANFMPTETWAPLTVWLRGGEKGFSGTLAVEYDQDATQGVRIVVPAAATPGTSVPVTATVCLPLHARSLVLSLNDQEGRSVAKQEYWAYGDGTYRRSWDAIIEPGGTAVLQLGEMSLQTAIRARDAVASPSGSSRPLTFSLPAGKNYVELLHSASSGGQLPLNWSAYTGLALLAVRAEEAERQDPRALEAVHRWVSGGGRLLILASRPGAAWRRWLPLDDNSDLFDIHEVERVETPASLRDVVVSTAEFTRGTPEDPSDEFAGPRPRLDAAAAASDMLARTISLRTLGVHHGWKLRHGTSESPAGTPRALIAEGPVGFGWVVVMGFEPELVAQIVEKPATTAVWEDAIHNALASFADTHIEENANRGSAMYYYGTGSSSAPTRKAQVALGTTLDSICRPSPPRMSLFFAICACLVTLAALVGPIDRIMLRRANLPHLSCATAIGWTLLASGAAAVVPSILRSDRTTLSRARVIDSLQLAQGTDRAIAWRTGLTAVFADSRSTFRFDETDASAWWRGVGASWWYGSGRFRGFSPLMCAQFQPSPGFPPPGCVPGQLSQGQWTLRCFQDEGPEPRVVRVILGEDEAGVFVQVHGLPEGSRLMEGVLRVRSGGVQLSAESATEPSEWILRAGKQLRQPGFPIWKKQPSEDLFLPALRGQAIDSRVESGSWACIYLLTDVADTDVGMTIPAEESMSTVYRILVPYSGELEEAGP